jgi:HAE1 family hydrophobic/amphiphilic exporter-1
VRGVTPLHLIHKWSIEHPYVVIAFYVAVLAMATLSITRAMPRRFAPYVQSPLVGVVTMMPGLSAREMELYISKPIEEQLVNIKGLRTIRSTSQEGFSIVTLEFAYGTDVRQAIFDVQALMNVIQSNLPATGANLKPSWVAPIDPLNIPILSLSLRGDPKQGWDPLRVREFADNTVINRLKGIPDVYSVVPFGGYRRQLQVIVDRDRLAAYRLSILDVRDAIDRFNVSRPAGTLTSGASEGIVRVDTRALRAEDVLNYPLTSVTAGAPAPGASDGPVGQDTGENAGSSGMGGMGGGAAATVPTGSVPAGTDAPRRSPRIVYVRDVARVVDTHWERRSAYHFLKHDPGTQGEVISSVQVSVIQDPGASSARVVPAVMKVVRQMESENPGLTFEVAYDNAHFVDILFQNVWDELLIAVLLTGLAVLFFLGEWRGTLIALVTLPTSLSLAVLLMAPFGMTFNSGTLIGLLLSIGRLVDDSIIDIHAVERHLRMGKDPKTATIDGIAEVRLAVLASTLMMVLALAPLLFVGGITEMMFRELVWPIIFGLLASMLVSFTLTALLCANLLRPEAEREADRRHPVLRWLYVPLDPFQRLLDRLENGYGRTIRWMLRHRFTNFARILATVIVGFTFYYFIGSEMMPLADVGQANGSLEMAPGTSFAQTERAVGQLEQIMLKHPELEKASIEIGQESMFESFSPFYTGYQMPQANGAALMLTFSDKDMRDRSIWEIIDSIQKEALATIPGLRRLQIKEMGSDVMATAAAPIHVNIYGPDLEELDRLGQQVLAVAGTMPELFQPGMTWSLGLPDYRIRVIPERAQEVGLSPETIAQQAYYALRGGLTNEFYRLPNLRQNTIMVRYEPEDRQAPELESLYVTAPDGRQIPLKSVATVERTVAPTAIEHDGLRRVVGITGYYRTGSLPSMDVVMNLVANAYGGNATLGIEPINFPPGYGIEMRGDMTQMMDSFRRLLTGLALALIFMYLVLVAQFRGFLQPLQMIASLPLELSGVFIALWLAHQAFSTVSILGIIVLTGMDITTAVLLIDMIMRYRDRGVPRDQAIIEACPQRLRPILMTAMISLIVMLPVALAPRTGLDAYQPLATAVVGGLLVGTILSLLDIPIMHTYVDDFVRWIHRTILDREWHWPVQQVAEGETGSDRESVPGAQCPVPGTVKDGGSGSAKELPLSAPGTGHREPGTASGASDR